MAGVTNAPFRAALPAAHGGGLYVNEMITARALVEGNAKTLRMASFRPDETAAQPAALRRRPGAYWARRSRRLVGEDRVDHVDLNFGCPAPKVTRRGGGAAIPAKPDLLRAIVARSA